MGTAQYSMAHGPLNLASYRGRWHPAAPDGTLTRDQIRLKGRPWMT